MTRMASPSTFFFSMKIVLITMGALSLVMALKFSVPLIMGFCLYDVPILWNSLQTWLKPPYLYFIANGIIIMLVASSRFSHHYRQVVNISATGQSQVPLITIRTPPQSDLVASSVLAEARADEQEEVHEAEEDESEVKVVEVNGVKQTEANDDDDVTNDDGWIVPNSDFTPTQKMASQDETQLDIVLAVKEKPLALSRFGHISMKPVTASPPEPQGGRAVRAVPRPRTRTQPQHDTMENTWKMITEGRHVPITSQFPKSSDTWENHGREVVLSSLDLDLDPRRRPPKSATFRDRSNYRDGSPAEIRKEPSLSQDELNRRAEAFIKKFNEEMRLQRQESLKQYTEMINRGAS